MKFKFQEKPDPIDVAVEKRLDVSGGRTEAYAWGEAEWDKAMNAAYKSLMKILPLRQQKALKTAQMEWFRHRDTEFAFMADLLRSSHHTPPSSASFARIALASDRLELVKARALRLRHYLAKPYADAGLDDE